ncbi:MAG: SGNH/GDSL hydrolase family protein [Thermoguttaceae bacterium]|nr:SGNH/GDSL hydrolase family protein [Thermoguttaceae bacterium]
MMFLPLIRLFTFLTFLTLFLTGFFTSSRLNAEETFFRVRNGIPNSQYFLKQNQTGNQYLFFIGSDLLNGDGLSNPNERWSSQLTRCLNEFFPDSRIIETRHPQPGGSWFAQYRTSGGQAVFGEVICSGHLAILELAVGDQGIDQIHAQRQIEGLIRQINQYRATHSVIVIYSLTPELFAAYQAGKEPEYVVWSERIMEHYGIPSLNLAKFISQKIMTGKISAEEFSKDGIHPTDAGQKLCGEAIREFTTALIEEFPTPENPVRIKLPEPLFPETNANGRIVAYELTQFSDGWRSGIESPIKPFRHLLVTEKAAETLTLQFTGTDVGLIDVSGPDSMDLEYSLDGGVWKKVPADRTNGNFTLRAIPFEEMLENREHTLILRTIGNGTARIGGILINGTIPDIYAGKTPLEKIDAIYARMKPVTCELTPDRFKYLPKTMERLRNGNSLRMVLLGDSIVGNTSSSQFELLLERKYPKCDIEKIASLRSSTGCGWYQHENRVQSYVIDKKPDFLIIGGISNGQDPESVRSVIRQVRAQLPKLEILFITPVFGAMRDDHIAHWSFIPAEGSFRAGMKKVCEEEKCAYFDMTAPWWKYISESGKTYGWFMGDAVHANARGCQIIGRLLELYFDSDK